jgi:uncharacterized protein
MSLQIQIDKARIIEFCRKWKITEFSIFGSALREDFDSESDVDILVTFFPNARWSLFDLVDMQEELKEILGREVDLVEREAIEKSENYIRRRHILSSAEKLYVA